MHRPTQPWYSVPGKWSDIAEQQHWPTYSQEWWNYCISLKVTVKLRCPSICNLLWYKSCAIKGLCFYLGRSETLSGWESTQFSWTATFCKISLMRDALMFYLHCKSVSSCFILFFRIFTLVPGDIILTGTPPGVGASRKPPLWLKVRMCFEVSFALIWQNSFKLLVNFLISLKGFLSWKLKFTHQQSTRQQNLLLKYFEVFRVLVTWLIIDWCDCSHQDRMKVKI